MRGAGDGRGVLLVGAIRVAVGKGGPLEVGRRGRGSGGLSTGEDGVEEVVDALDGLLEGRGALVGHGCWPPSLSSLDPDANSFLCAPKVRPLR